MKTRGIGDFSEWEVYYFADEITIRHLNANSVYLGETMRGPWAENSGKPWAEKPARKVRISQAMKSHDVFSHFDNFLHTEFYKY